MVLYFITLLQLLSWAVVMMRVILPAINRWHITVQNAVVLGSQWVKSQTRTGGSLSAGAGLQQLVSRHASNRRSVFIMFYWAGNVKPAIRIGKLAVLFNGTVEYLRWSI